MKFPLLEILSISSLNSSSDFKIFVAQFTKISPAKVSFIGDVSVSKNFVLYSFSRFLRFGSMMIARQTVFLLQRYLMPYYHVVGQRWCDFLLLKNKPAVIHRLFICFKFVFIEWDRIL